MLLGKNFKNFEMLTFLIEKKLKKTVKESLFFCLFDFMFPVSKKHNKIRGNTCLTGIYVKGCSFNTPELSICFDFTKEKKFSRLQKQAIKKMKNYIDFIIKDQKYDVVNDDALNNQIIKNDNQILLEKVDINGSQNSLPGEQHDIAEEYKNIDNSFIIENKEIVEKRELETIEISAVPNKNNFISANMDDLCDGYFAPFHGEYNDFEYDKTYNDCLYFNF